MSYILEALKKAEHQREIGQVPRIDSEHEPAATGLSSRWGIIVVLVLLVNAGVLLVLFWPGSSTDLPEPVATLPHSSPGTRVNPRPDTRHSEYAGVVQEPVVSRGVRLRPVASPPIRTVPPPHIAPPQASRHVGVMPAAPPANSPAPAPVQHARDLPEWPRVPTHIFQQLHGNLRLDVHVYSEQPRDRFVLINLQKYHEGEQLQEGPVVDEITAEGVVLSLQGQQFLVRAQ